MIQNFLPQDTRLAEIASAFGMLILSALLATGVTQSYELMVIHPPAFWAVCLSVLGLLQLLALVLYPEAEILRCAASWTNGTFWTWLSLNALSFNVSPNDLGSFVLGIANLYAFVVNVNLQRQSWES